MTKDLAHAIYGKDAAAYRMILTRKFCYVEYTRMPKSDFSQDLSATTSPEPNTASDQTWSDDMDADSSN